MSSGNRRIVLADHPVGEPTAADFRLEEVAMPVPKDGQVLLRTIYLSLDPYMRRRIDAADEDARAVRPGRLMPGGTICEVVESRAPKFRIGDLVTSAAGWRHYSVADARTVRALDIAAMPSATALGVLGMPGFTGYSGLVKIGAPRPGETVVVAAATGPVGSTVGQVARLTGARVVGIAGGPRKCAHLVDDLGFDAAIDHRSPDFAHRLAAAVPGGIDVYFENVGGAVLDAVLPLLNEFCRIPLCGLVSQYNATDVTRIDRLPGFLDRMLEVRGTVRAFAMTEFVSELYKQFVADLSTWIGDGRFVYREDITDGLENAPQAFIGMLRGENLGKTIVRM
jgi:NADPH2:quinone reductase